MSQFARELGISVKQLNSWRSQYKINGSESFPGNGNITVSDDAKTFAQLSKKACTFAARTWNSKKDYGIISMSDLSSID